MRKEKGRCSNAMSLPSQYPWCRAEKKMQQWCINAIAIHSSSVESMAKKQKENKEEKKV